MFAFLKAKHSSLMVVDPTDSDINLSKLHGYYSLKNAYSECKEELTPNAPQQSGIGMTMRTFVAHIVIRLLGAQGQDLLSSLKILLSIFFLRSILILRHRHSARNL